MTRIRFGFSPCPNDTHAFWAVAQSRIRVPGVEIEPVMADIEELNLRALGPDPLEMTKLSTGVLVEAESRYRVLDSGAALGRGVGPLVVAGVEGRRLGDLQGCRVAVPGLRTTAWSLLRRFGPAVEPVVMRFDQILAAVARGRVEAGLVIHESRFTYREHGLFEVADLGSLWEAERGLPLPLAVIGLRRDLPAALIHPVTAALSESVRLARSAPLRTRPFVRAHAQELSDRVCDQHIALYVNRFSERLGLEGRLAVAEFRAIAGQTD